MPIPNTTTFEASNDSSTESTVPRWVSIIVLLGVMLLGTGAVIALIRPALLVGPHEEINGAVRIYAGYLVSRNLGLAIMLLAALVVRARRALGTMMLLVGLIQFLDVGIDCIEGRWNIVPGIIVLGALFVVGAAHVGPRPFWKIKG
jgi:hypothetical protein